MATSLGPHPVRDASRHGCSPSAAASSCLVCTQALPSTRAIYCSATCHQRAFRLRRAARTGVGHARQRAELRRRGALAAHTLYECSGRGERLVDERRCPDCNVFCRALGLGGRFTQCDQPLLLAELLGLEVVT